MKKMFKRLVAMCLAMVLSLGVLGTGSVAYAAEGAGDSIITELGLKTAQQLSQGRYEITVDVPGMDGDMYNEIIIMVDASTSQKGNFNSLKQTLRDIGAAVLNEKGSVHLTLMGFGMSAKTVGTFTKLAELEALLETVTQGDLLYGRSATNCETSFTHIQEYIENSPKLNKTFVIYTSDGGTNFDDTLFEWRSWEVRETLSAMKLQNLIAAYAEIEALNVAGFGGDVQDITKNMFDVAEEVAALKAFYEKYGNYYSYTSLNKNDPVRIDYLNALVQVLDPFCSKFVELNADGYPEKGVAWADTIWKAVFDFAGLEYVAGVKYASSTVEKAFTDYFRDMHSDSMDQANNSCDIFYYTILDCIKNHLTHITNHRTNEP